MSGWKAWARNAILAAAFSIKPTCTLRGGRWSSCNWILPPILGNWFNSQASGFELAKSLLLLTFLKGIREWELSGSSPLLISPSLSSPPLLSYLCISSPAFLYFLLLSPFCFPSPPSPPLPPLSLSVFLCVSMNIGFSNQNKIRQKHQKMKLNLSLHLGMK